MGKLQPHNSSGSDEPSSPLPKRRRGVITDSDGSIDEDALNTSALGLNSSPAREAPKYRDIGTRTSPLSSTFQLTNSPVLRAIETVRESDVSEVISCKRSVKYALTKKFDTLNNLAPNHGLNNIQAYSQTNIEKTLGVAIPLQCLNDFLAFEKIIEDDEGKAEISVSFLYNI